MKILRNSLIILFTSLFGYLTVFSILHYFKVVNKELFSLIGLAVFLVLAIVYCYITRNKVNIYKYNQGVYAHPFKRGYHTSAKNELLDVKALVFTSILLGFMLIAKAFPLPTGFGRLGISLGFIFYAIIGLLYGPYMALIAGFISDNLGFLMFPPSALYFFGYTLNAMLSGLFYGLFFYKTRITFTKVFLCRFVVNILINGILGTCWVAFLGSYNFEQFQVYFLTRALPKNLAYLIPQSVTIFIIFKSLSRLFVHVGLMDQDVKDNITIF